MEGVSHLVKREVKKAVRKEEVLEKKKKKLEKTKSNGTIEKAAPVFVLPKLESAKQSVVKGQVCILSVSEENEKRMIFCKRIWI